uniref:Endonuclease/exonuclease/phosphatase domain-containing protein n=1 Tax=Quercus lobata TaxID=97700 RepID=A0A7N2R501_QUELO
MTHLMGVDLKQNNDFACTEKETSGLFGDKTENSMHDNTERQQCNPIEHNDHYKLKLLGAWDAVDVITELVRSKGPNVMFLMETNWSIVEMRRLCFDLNFQSVMAVLCDGRSGGLSMFWKLDCNLHIQTFSPKHIDAHILPINQRRWCLIGFHGRPEGLRKQESWYFLKNLHARSSLPWVYMGDYNEALHSTEKQGGLPK